MEKQQENLEPEDSMTTVIMKDYTPGMDYPDPPPSYKTARSSTAAVQITKIIAISGIIIAGIISFAIISSAWLASNGTCHENQPIMAESLLAPQQLLQSAALLKSIDDLDAAERKLEAKDKNVSSEEDSAESSSGPSGDDDDTVVTIFNLGLKEMLASGEEQRIPLTCVFEKQNPAEPDEKHRTLPPLFSLNISTDSKCLRFTGENISICCDLKDGSQQQSTKVEEKPSVISKFSRFSRLPQSPFQQSLRNINSAAAASQQQPLQVIGPIPIGAQRTLSLPEILQEFWGGGNGLEQMIPLLQAPEEQPNVHIQVEGLGLGPLFMPHGHDSGSLSQFLNAPRPDQRIKLSHRSFPEADNQGEMPLLVQASDIRQRALHHPIQLVPRHHFPHVIRPRSPIVQPHHNEGI